MSYILSYLPAIRFGLLLKRDALYLVSLMRAGKSADTEIRVKVKWGELLVLASLLSVGFLSVHYRHWIAATYIFSHWAVDHRGPAATVIGCLGLLGGIALASWKRKQLVLYGLFEIAFGTFSVFQIGLVFLPAADLAKFIGLASSLYVISRGTGNLYEAFRQEAEKDRLFIGAKKSVNLSLLNALYAVRRQASFWGRVELASEYAWMVASQGRDSEVYKATVSAVRAKLHRF